MGSTKSNHVIYSLDATGTITDSVPMSLTGTGLLEIMYERDSECGAARTTISWGSSNGHQTSSVDLNIQVYIYWGYRWKGKGNNRGK
jgi:hypothetical protein